MPTEKILQWLPGHGAGFSTPSGVHFVFYALTHLVHGAGEREVPVLAVHVVRAGTGVVTEPDAVVVDDAGVLLRQLVVIVVGDEI